MKSELEEEGERQEWKASGQDDMTVISRKAHQVWEDERKEELGSTGGEGK